MTTPGIVGSTTDLPPDAYWTHLENTFSHDEVEALELLSASRVNELEAYQLPGPSGDALLRRFADDGFVEIEERPACASQTCENIPTEDDISAGRCPQCDEPLTPATAVRLVFVRELAQTRDVDWVVVIHGMNTKGRWQEEFSWFMATTWGRSVPVAIYKYGIIIAGVLMPWRRNKLKNRLRKQLTELRDQARNLGYGDRPDIVAHSFGTWLLGQILKDDLTANDPLRFGRMILLGCVIRPDFPWAEVKQAELVAEVLNHYGTKDPIVVLAHWGIRDSGPSGRRGFDTDEVLNVRAEGLGHSHLFSVDRCVVAGEWLQDCPAAQERGARHLDRAYEDYWRPFLTLPSTEFDQIPDQEPPPVAWKQAPALLRGTVAPLIVLPLLAVLLMLLVTGLGNALSGISSVLWWAAGTFGLSALVYGTLVLLWLGWRRLVQSVPWMRTRFGQEERR